MSDAIARLKLAKEQQDSKFYAAGQALGRGRAEPIERQTLGTTNSKVAIEISFYSGVDHDLALDVMEEYGSLFVSAIAVQLAAGRAPALAHMFESDDGSVLVYAGNRSFARSEGLRVNNETAALYAVVMPLHCALANRIVRGMLASPGVSVFYPDAEEN